MQPHLAFEADGDKEKGGRPSRASSTSCFGERAAVLAALVLAAIFCLCAALGSSLMSTGWYCFLLALTLLSSAVPLRRALEGGGKHRIAMRLVLTLFAMASLVSSVASAANACGVFKHEVADAVLSCLVTLAGAALAVLIGWTRSHRRPPSRAFRSVASDGKLARSSSQPSPSVKRRCVGGCGLGCGRTCSACCSYTWLTLALALAVLAAWHAAAKASYATRPTMPGVLVEAPNAPATHIYCEGTNASLPTVLYLNGFYGSSLDPAWLRREPSIAASGVRFCSIDRPGAGWSEYGRQYHFGHAARYMRDAMRAELAAGRMGGRVVVVFHSLGGYVAPALAYELRNDPQLALVGAVAADAMTPSWEEWDTPKAAAECSIGAGIDCGAWEGCGFWRMTRVFEPSGLLRLLLIGGFGGFDTSIRALPADVQADYIANVMQPKQFQNVLAEGSAMRVNCGYAKQGEAHLAAAAARAFEVLVVPDGLNLTGIVGATRVEVLPLPCHPPDSAGPSCHQSVVLDREYSKAVSRAVMRVVSATVESA